MSRTLATLAVSLIVGIAPATLAAQSDDAIASITVGTGGTATVVNTQGLDFGTQLAGTFANSSDVGAAAAWDVTFNAAASYVVTFTLPADLVDGAGLSAVPSFFGTTSASSPQIPAPAGWDPHGAMSFGVPTAGAVMDIFLGADVLGDGTGDAAVDLTAGPFSANPYTGVITLTVAQL